MNPQPVTSRPHRRGAIAPLLLAAVLSALPVAGAAAGDGGETETAEALVGVSEVVVALVPGAVIDDVARDFGVTSLRALPGSPDVHLVAVPDGADVTALSAALSRDARVRFAEPNHAGSTPEGHPSYAWGRLGAEVVGTDPAAWTSQGALDQIGVAAAHRTSTGEGVVVAVLDTGIQADHPALSGRLAPGGTDLLDGDGDPADAPNGVDEDGDGLVDEAAGHGTHVTGTVLAVAPDAQVLPIRVLTSDGSGFVFPVAEGIRYAVAAGADVINLSLGTTVESQLLSEVLDSVGEGVTVVASAGNGGSTQLLYPAGSNGVLAVASVDPADVRSVFSNHGAVDVAAPGEGVVSTYLGGSFAAWDGTSMAAPLVAGQAALLTAMGVEEVPSAIRGTAVPVDRSLGAGRVDVGASLAAAAAGADRD